MEILNDIVKIDKKTGIKSINFPNGCNDCDMADPWQCKEACLWPSNYWKYDEVRYYYELARYAMAGLDLNRIDNLLPYDFLKVGLIKDIL